MVGRITEPVLADGRPVFRPGPVEAPNPARIVGRIGPGVELAAEAGIIGVFRLSLAQLPLAVADAGHQKTVDLAQAGVDLGAVVGPEFHVLAVVGQARQDFFDGTSEPDEEDEWEDEGVDEDGWDHDEWEEEDAGDDESNAPSGWVESLLQDVEPDDAEPAAWSEPIINTGPKVGRNDPCPCGSGKKYKKCCLRKQGDS